MLKKVECILFDDISKLKDELISGYSYVYPIIPKDTDYRMGVCVKNEDLNEFVDMLKSKEGD